LTGSAQPRTPRSKYAQQPQDSVEGARQAYDSLSHGLSSAAKVLASPGDEFRRGHVRGGVKKVLVAVPAAVLRSVGGLSEAIGKLGLGVANAVDPVRKLEADDKWK